VHFHASGLTSIPAPLQAVGHYCGKGDDRDARPGLLAGRHIITAAGPLACGGMHATTRPSAWVCKPVLPPQHPGRLPAARRASADIGSSRRSARSRWDSSLSIWSLMADSLDQLRGCCETSSQPRLRRGDVPAENSLCTDCAQDAVGGLRLVRRSSPDTSTFSSFAEVIPQTGDDLNTGDGRRGAHNQRSQVQILPPLLILQVRGLFRLWRGLLAAACAQEIVNKPFRPPSGWLDWDIRHDLRLCGTRRTILLAFLVPGPEAAGGFRSDSTSADPLWRAPTPGLACAQGTRRPHRGHESAFVSRAEPPFRAD